MDKIVAISDQVGLKAYGLKVQVLKKGKKPE